MHKAEKTTIKTTIHPDIPTVSEQIRGKYLGDSTNKKQRIIARIILIAGPILLALYIVAQILISEQ